MCKAAFCFALAVTVGCSTTRTADLSASGRVRATDLGSDVLDVTPPVVTAVGNDMVVTGTVTRRPGFDGPVPGRLVVTVLGPDGQTELQSIPTGWDPPHIPTTGDRRATYRVRYGYLPPDGSIVRVGHEPHPGSLDDVADDAAAYRPGYRASDRSSRLLGGLGGVNERQTIQQSQTARQR